jgi:hypothetical protein
MGLIRELFDELIPLPNSCDYFFQLKSNVDGCQYKPAYAILNSLFQIIDCIVIPYFAIIYFRELRHHAGIIHWGIFLLLGFSSVFSIYQVLYWFIKPVEKYVSFKDRILGETTIGALLSALFKIRIYYYTK